MPTLHWDETNLPFGDTRLTDPHTVTKSQAGNRPIVRAKEVISASSGPMTWWVSIADHYVLLGVVSAEYNGTDHKSTSVWMTYGSGSNWDKGNGQKVVVNNEAEGAAYCWGSGDIVEVSYDPSTRLLTFKVQSKPGWSTTRRLEGPGLDEVHPCVVLWSNTSARVVGRRGVSKQEHELSKQQQFQQQQRHSMIDREATKRTVITGTEADARHTLVEERYRQRDTAMTLKVARSSVALNQITQQDIAGLRQAVTAFGDSVNDSFSTQIEGLNNIVNDHVTSEIQKVKAELSTNMFNGNQQLKEQVTALEGKVQDSASTLKEDIASLTVQITTLGVKVQASSVTVQKALTDIRGDLREIVQSEVRLLLQAHLDETRRAQAGASCESCTRKRTAAGSRGGNGGSSDTEAPGGAGRPQPAQEASSEGTDQTGARPQKRQRLFSFW